MSGNFTTSSKQNPCPICSREKDSDCRMREAENLVLCHTYQDKQEPINGYEWIKRSDKGAGWGLWAAEKPKKAARPEPAKRLEFIYHDRDCKPLLRVTRQGREFYQSRYENGLWINGLTDAVKQQVPIYRYPEIQRAIAEGLQIFWVEGEGVAEALWQLGIPATTTVGGCKAYRKYGNYSEDLQGADIVLCPDRDKLGISYMQEVAQDYPDVRWCRVYPKSPLWQRLPDNGGLDAVDWIAEGATAADFSSAIAPSLFPEQKPESKGERSPDYHESLDQVDLLESAIANDAELNWHVQNYAFDSELSKRGFSGPKLLQFARARRDGSAEIEVVDAHDILDEHSKPDYLIAGNLLKGVVMTIAGIGGSGKTVLLYNFARSIALGVPWSGYRTQQGRCLMVQADEPKTNIAQKLRIAQFRDVPRGMVQFITRWRFSQFRQLEKLVKEGGFSFVMIDSWTATHAGLGIDLTKSNAGDNAYRLRDLAEDTGATIVIVHHLNKLGELRDSSALHDNVSDVWRLHKGKESDRLLPSQRVLSIDKSRSDLMGDYLLEQNATDYSWYHLGLLANPDLPGDPPLISRLLDFLCANQGEQFSAKDISERLNCDYSKADLELQRLFRQGLIESEWVIWSRPGHAASGFWLYHEGAKRQTHPAAVQASKTTANGYTEEDF